MSGYVYFIRQAVTGLTKIGLAKDPWKRLWTLDAKHGGLSLWLTIPTTAPSHTEAWFHRYFEEFHYRLEWFKLTDEQLNKDNLRHLASLERRQRHRGIIGSSSPARTHHKEHKVNINQAFPSKWLKADDCEDGDLVLTIKRVTQEEVGKDDMEVKPVVYFRETEKGLVLNKTNAKTIANLHGPETDEWKGKRIALFATEVSMGGQQTMGLRVRLKAPKAAPEPAGVGAKSKAADDDEDDPFADE